MKILIVDDDLGVVRSLGNTFTTLLRGYLVLTATTANQGLNYIKEEKPEVIIMDVRLGPVSGMDLLEDYAKHAEHYRPEMIVITAFDDEKARKKAAELKVAAFLMKPFDNDELVDATLGAIEKRLDSELRSIRLVRAGFQHGKNIAERAKQRIVDRMGRKPDSGHAGGKEGESACSS